MTWAVFIDHSPGNPEGKLLLCPPCLAKNKFQEFFPAYLPKFRSFQQVFSLVYFLWHGDRVPVTTPRSSPCKVPSHSCCMTSSLFFPDSFSVLLHQAPEHQLCPGFLAHSLLYGKPLPLQWGWWLCQLLECCRGWDFPLSGSQTLLMLKPPAKTPSNGIQLTACSDSISYQWFSTGRGFKIQASSGEDLAWNWAQKWISRRGDSLKSRHACIVLWAVLGDSWLLLQKVLSTLGGPMPHLPSLSADLRAWHMALDGYRAQEVSWEWMRQLITDTKRGVVQ